MTDPALAAILDRLTSIVERLERESSDERRVEQGRALGVGKQPRRVNLLMVLNAIPSLAARMKAVPNAAIEENNDREAMVNCPCGHHPVADETITKCPGCERYYTYDEKVYVIYGEMPLPADPQTAAPA